MNRDISLRRPYSVQTYVVKYILDVPGEYYNLIFSKTKLCIKTMLYYVYELLLPVESPPCRLSYIYDSLYN